MKNTILTVITFISLLSTTTLHAQEKYEFGELYVKANAVILITNKDYEKLSPPKGTVGEVFGIQYLDKLTSEGWEIINGAIIPDNYGNVGATKYFLRKKKQ